MEVRLLHPLPEGDSWQWDHVSRSFFCLNHPTTPRWGWRSSEREPAEVKGVCWRVGLCVGLCVRPASGWAQRWAAQLSRARRICASAEGQPHACCGCQQLSWGFGGIRGISHLNTPWGNAAACLTEVLGATKIVLFLGQSKQAELEQTAWPRRTSMASVQTQRKCGFAISAWYISAVAVLLVALLLAENTFCSCEEIYEEILGGCFRK